MRLLRHTIAVLTLAGGLTFNCPLPAGAQNPPPSVPPVPVMRSPVDAFRELLTLDSAQLRLALTNRSETARKRLIEKIQEYRAMDVDERELRLLSTETSWYLRTLMPLDAAQRQPMIADMRADLRPLIESRLARWDVLPLELRDQFLQNESSLALLLQLGTASERLREKLVAEVASGLRDSLRQALARLDSMTTEDRQRAFDTVESVFNMTAAEKQRALRAMSDSEKKLMEQTIEAFGKLSSEQRRTCVRSYERFASMTPVERGLFLRNVQQWEKMSVKERAQWRSLVKNVELLPPLPPTKQILPPMPPGKPTSLTNKT